MYIAGPGGRQQVLYEDVGSELQAITNMVWVEIHIYPCGIELPQTHPGFTELSYILQGTVVGALANPVTGIIRHGTFTAGNIAPVPDSAFHSAENPSCTEEIILQQAQSGGVSAPNVLQGPAENIAA
ncbi:hypothetical protein WJX74_005713 [Apatococcus lobatus]|uniref:Cupin type-1 domain-containing protein n=1 Tax=Apatococcus lobatus TaxID=904363 RepID=A0AAW1RJG3_9CHLO